MLSQPNISACTHYRYAWKHSTALAHIHVGNSKGQLAYSHTRSLTLTSTHQLFAAHREAGLIWNYILVRLASFFVVKITYLDWQQQLTRFYIKKRNIMQVVFRDGRGSFFLVHSGALTVYRQFLKSYICHIFFTSSEWQKASSGQILHHYIRNLFQLRFYLYIIHCAHWWYYRPSRYSSPLYAPVCE